MRNYSRAYSGVNNTLISEYSITLDGRTIPLLGKSLNGFMSKNSKGGKTRFLSLLKAGRDVRDEYVEKVRQILNLDVGDEEQGDIVKGGKSYKEKKPVMATKLRGVIPESVEAYKTQATGQEMDEEAPEYDPEMKAELMREGAKKEQEQEMASVKAQQFQQKQAEEFQKSQQYSKGGYVKGPSHAQGGVKVKARLGGRNVDNIEIEGGEYVVNKKATQKYKPLLEKINKTGLTGNGKALKQLQIMRNKKKFPDGGTVPSEDGGAVPSEDGGAVPKASADAEAPTEVAADAEESVEPEELEDGTTFSITTGKKQKTTKVYIKLTGDDGKPIFKLRGPKGTPVLNVISPTGDIGKKLYKAYENKLKIELKLRAKKEIERIHQEVERKNKREAAEKKQQADRIKAERKQQADRIKAETELRRISEESAKNKENEKKNAEEEKRKEWTYREKKGDIYRFSSKKRADIDAYAYAGTDGKAGEIILPGDADYKTIKEMFEMLDEKPESSGPAKPSKPVPPLQETRAKVGIPKKADIQYTGGVGTTSGVSAGAGAKLSKDDGKKDNSMYPQAVGRYFTSMDFTATLRYIKTKYNKRLEDSTTEKIKSLSHDIAKALGLKLKYTGNDRKILLEQLLQLITIETAAKMQKGKEKPNDPSNSKLMAMVDFTDIYGPSGQLDVGKMDQQYRNGGMVRKMYKTGGGVDVDPSSLAGAMLNNPENIESLGTGERITNNGQYAQPKPELNGQFSDFQALGSVLPEEEGAISAGETQFKRRTFNLSDAIYNAELNFSGRFAEKIRNPEDLYNDNLQFRYKKVEPKRCRRNIL